MLLAIFGPDGSGKSTIADAVTAKLHDAGIVVTRQHWRPAIFPGRGKEACPEALTAIRTSTPRGSLTTVLYLVFYWCDFALGAALRSHAERAGVRLAERYYYDVLIDPARYRLLDRPRLATFLAWLAPRPHACIFLGGDPATISARKSELTVAEVRVQLERIRRIRRLLDDKKCLSFDTTRMSIDAVAEGIVARALQHFAVTPTRSSRSVAKGNL